MKKQLKLLFLALVFGLFISSCNNDDDQPILPTDVATVAELTQALEDIYTDTEVPGFALTVVKNDQILYQEAFGLADIAANKAYTNQTTQPIGSISKTFIAAALVKAMEQGHFDLDTDINDILPFNIQNPKQPNATIRVRDLVTHTSGLVDKQDIYINGYHILPGEDVTTPGASVMMDGFGVDQRATIALSEFLAAYYVIDGATYSSDNFAATTPGETWSYSNIASSLAAFLVETATGISFKQYVKDNILAPLNMTATAYDFSDLNPNEMAKLYWDKNTPLPLYAHESYPDGSIMTSSEDLTKYLLDMMQGIKGESTRLFSSQGYSQLFEALLPAGVTPSYFADNQGIFWFLQSGYVRHDGSDPGTTSDLQFSQDGKEGFLLISNMDASIEEHEIAWANFSTKVKTVVSQFIQAN